VVTAVSGEPVTDGDKLVRTIAALRPGSEIRLDIVRDGAALRVGARLQERGPDEESGGDGDSARPTAAPIRRGDALGLAVANLPARIRAELRVPRDRQGVVIQAVLGADPGTDLLEEGDLVVEVNRQPTPDLSSYRRVMGALQPGDSAWLFVYRPRSRDSILTRIEVERRP
jgi:serine protease Do